MAFSQQALSVCSCSCDPHTELLRDLQWTAQCGWWLDKAEVDLPFSESLTNRPAPSHFLVWSSCSEGGIHSEPLDSVTWQSCPAISSHLDADERQGADRGHVKSTDNPLFAGRLETLSILNLCVREGSEAHQTGNTAVELTTQPSSIIVDNPTVACIAKAEIHRRLSHPWEAWA